jgi:hypothetical protein
VDGKNQGLLLISLGRSNNDSHNYQQITGRIVDISLDKNRIEVVDDMMAEVLRKKTPAERIAIGFGLWTSARKMLLSHLGSTHPE